VGESVITDHRIGDEALEAVTVSQGRSVAEADDLGLKGAESASRGKIRYRVSRQRQRRQLQTWAPCGQS
jgi:hypothetical protein